MILAQISEVVQSLARGRACGVSAHGLDDQIPDFSRNQLEVLVILPLKFVQANVVSVEIHASLIDQRSRLR